MMSHSKHFADDLNFENDTQETIMSRQNYQAQPAAGNPLAASQLMKLGKKAAEKADVTHYVTQTIASQNNPTPASRLTQL